MRKFFGYIRVSTVKQGERGVSLQEQRDAITRYAARYGLEIVQWFEERQTAAKRGRPVFNQMLRLLKCGKADGVIIHKIDRSARNLKDWADLGDLIDQGVTVHFANEDLDLQSRGGRLSADIQAVVAADYIRNLREEARKGIYGRLKQGFYPLPAPLGYLDRGKAKAKEPDPVSAPLVQRAFELYATGAYGLDSLLEEMRQFGLRGRWGGELTRSGLSSVLNNPFYVGLIYIHKTQETFQGVHQPLISKTLFDRVQQILRGKTNARSWRHDYAFRRLIACKHCGYSLIAERQKGFVYYRCHTPTCPSTCIREEAIDAAILQAFSPLVFTDEESIHLERMVGHLRADWKRETDEHKKTLTLKVSYARERIGRLTDAYLDGAIDRETYEERKRALLMERKEAEELLDQFERNPQAVPDLLAKYLELSGRAFQAYKQGIPDEKRVLISSITSNRWADGKSLAITLSQPFSELANRHKDAYGGPYRDTPRTLDTLIRFLMEWITSNPLPDLLAKKMGHASMRVCNHPAGEEG